MGRLTVDLLDLELLGELVDSRDWEAGYLDPTSGEVIQCVDGEIHDENGEATDPEAHWLPVGGGSANEAYADMEHFARSLADRRMADRLERALEGSGPFRRFRDVLHHEADETTGRAWAAYRRERSRLRAIAWLGEQGVVDADGLSSARTTAEAAAGAALREVGVPASGSRVVLVNGMPGAGKSTLAARYRDEHPGVLVVEVDVLRTWIGGDPGDHAENAESAEVLALALVRAHLGAGRDVVLPQLVVRLEQVEQLERVAAECGAELVEVVLHGGTVDSRVPDAAVDHLVEYAHGLADVVARRPGTHRLATRHGDVESAYRALADLLDPDVPA